MGFDINGIKATGWSMESQCQTPTLEMPFGQVDNCSYVESSFCLCKLFLKRAIFRRQRPNLSEFINGRSLLKWEVKKMDHSHLDWMSQDVEFWDQDENFLKLSEGVKKSRLWMIPVKKSFNLQREKRIKSVRSETRFHQTLLLVHELNLLCLGIKRGSFDKKAWVSIFLAISYQRLSFLKVGHACFFSIKRDQFSLQNQLKN